MSGARPRQHELSYKIRHAFQHPERILPFLVRAATSLRYRLLSRGSHPEYYRRIMSRRYARGAQYAVGTESEDEWRRLGELQRRYLVDNGLRPHHRLLDVGCGNLRAGLLIIDYLDRANYVGVDLSPEVITDGQRRIAAASLAHKRPYIYLTDGTDLTFLPDRYFDVMHAHSVFSHVPSEVIEGYISESHRLLAPGGWFDFTFLEGDSHGNFLREDFFYTASEMLALVEKYGGVAIRMQDWQHPQTKFRISFP